MRPACCSFWVLVLIFASSSSSLAAVAAASMYQKVMSLCSEEVGQPWCDWSLTLQLNSSSTASMDESCQSIVSTEGGSQPRLQPRFVEMVSNRSGTAKDISYDRLWSEEPTFRVWANLSAINSRLVDSPISSLFVNMLPDSYNRFCNDSQSEEQQSRFWREFSPRQGCKSRNMSPLAHPVIGMPWCGHWNASAVIGKIRCGVAESGQSHRHTVWSIYSKYGIISAKDAHNHQSPIKALRSRLEPDARIEVHEEVGVVGYSEYPNSPGHFPNEVLPKLLFMDMFLPRRVPLLWPHSNNHGSGCGSLASSYEGLLRSKGLLSSSRRIIHVEVSDLGVAVAKTIVAKSLYFVTTSTRAGEPLCLWSLHRLMATVLKRISVGSNNSTTGASEGSDATHSNHGKVILLKRGNGRGARSLANHEQLVTALRGALDVNTTASASSIVQEFEVGKNGISLAEVAKRLARGKIFIAPHGAGLNNMILLPPNATIIEIGYLGPKGAFSWPSDYLCLSRNLGFHYYASVAVSGDHDSPLTVDVAEVLQIVQATFQA